MGIQKDIIEIEARMVSNQAMGELKKLESQTSSLRRENERLKTQKLKLEVLNKQETKEYKELTARIKKNTATIKENGSRMATLRKQVGVAAMSMKDLRKEARVLQGQLDSTSKAANPKEYDRLEKELGQVRKQMSSLRGSASRTQKIMRTFGAILPIAGVSALAAGAGRLVKELFNVGKQMQGESRKHAIVLGDSLKYVEEKADELSKKMGATNHEFKTMVTNTADLLVPLDFTRKKAAEMAVTVQSLAGAFDEWTAGQYGVADASDTLNAAMLGEMERLKKYGIAIKQDSKEFKELVKQKLAEGAATDAQAKALATLELIMKKSKDAQTAYNQEGNKLLRTQKNLSRWWHQLKEDTVAYFDTRPSEKLKNEQIGMEGLVNAITDVNISQENRVRLMQRLQDKYPDLLENLDSENVTNEQLRDRMTEVNEQYKVRIALMAAQEFLKDSNKERLALEIKELDILEGIETKKLKVEEKAGELVKARWGFQRDALIKEAMYKRLDIALDERKLRKTRDAIEKAKERELKLEERINKIMKENGELLDSLSGSDDDDDDGNKVNNDLLLDKLDQLHAEELIRIKKRYTDELDTKTQFDTNMLIEEMAYQKAKADLLTSDEDKRLGALQKYANAELKLFKYWKDQEQDTLDEFIKETLRKTKQENDALEKDSFETEEAMLRAKADSYDKESKLRKKDAEDQRKLLEKKVDIYNEYAESIGVVLGNAIVDGEMSMEEFGVQMISVGLDILRKQLHLMLAELDSKAVVKLASGDISGVLLAGGAHLAVEAIYAGAKSAVSGKSYSSGGYTPDGLWNQPQGVVHSEEWVGNRYAVRNPEVRQFLDVFDLAQRTGQVNNLNTEAILRAVEIKRGGFADGGYSIPGQPTITFDPKVVVNSDPKLEALLTQLLKYGVKATMSYQQFRDTETEYKSIQDRINI